MYEINLSAEIKLEVICRKDIYPGYNINSNINVFTIENKDGYSEFSDFIASLILFFKIGISFSVVFQTSFKSTVK